MATTIVAIVTRMIFTLETNDYHDCRSWCSRMYTPGDNCRQMTSIGVHLCRPWCSRNIFTLITRILTPGDKWLSRCTIMYATVIIVSKVKSFWWSWCSRSVHSWKQLHTDGYIISRIIEMTAVLIACITVSTKFIRFITDSKYSSSSKNIMLSSFRSIMYAHY